MSPKRERPISADPILLPALACSHLGAFVTLILGSTETLSAGGRVARALVDAKLRLRFPSHMVTRCEKRGSQTFTEFTVGSLRVIVAIPLSDEAFNSAGAFAKNERQVFFVVPADDVEYAHHRIKKMRCRLEWVRVKSVDDFVTDYMHGVATDLSLTPAQFCLKFIAEYNRRIAADGDPSLQVLLPAIE
ncbi:DUF4928 family protein [Anatilimnocola floriformis]|uniref:DUF4928 family protein n=1 Tax=Anatilimnocola floriformis TaxID=2948575 RepID=UPI0020C572DF|nr:DUF4928 family protein [Anatilimnocola floriformis]